MNSFHQTIEKLFDMEYKEVLIASHRGKFCSSVMENTSLAFLTAIGQGADMVEMDLAKTKDGRIVGHHDDTMERLFHSPLAISDHSWEELKGMTVYNYMGEPCTGKLEAFDFILEALEDKTILVLDKCWDCWDEVLDLLEKHEMTGQAVFKFYIEDETALSWAFCHKDCMFIPMVKDVPYLDKLFALKQEALVPAVEILPEQPSDPIFQKELLERLKLHQIKVWCNSLSLSRDIVYGAGYDDLKSLQYGGDQGWGRLADQGVSIIQTDWPYELKRYLESRRQLSHLAQTCQMSQSQAHQHGLLNSTHLTGI